MEERGRLKPAKALGKASEVQATGRRVSCGPRGDGASKGWGGQRLQAGSLWAATRAGSAQWDRTGWHPFICIYFVCFMSHRNVKDEKQVGGKAVAAAGVHD